MSRYIDRDAVRRAIQEYCFSPYEVTPDGIAKVVMNVPPADVVEVRHGEWIDRKEIFSEYEGEEIAIGCSICSKSQRKYRKTNYCPNCGADMRGKNNGQE
jgi:NADH pyrophosphatase NudC (nudix superfamily)